MKTIKVSFLLTYLFIQVLTLSASTTISHKAELLWGQKGIVVNLFNTKTNLNLNDNEFNYFVRVNGELIKSLKSDYFKLSIAHPDSIDVWLDSKNKMLSAMMVEFSKINHSESISALAAISSGGPICDNINFESGTSVGSFNSNWVLNSGFACGGMGCNGFAPVTVSTLPLNDITTRYSITGAGYDPNISIMNLPTVKPGGSFSFRLENHANGGDASQLTRVITIDASKPFYKYSFAAVLEDPGEDHPELIKPYFYFRLKDGSGNVIACSEYKAVANPKSQEIKENFMYDNSSGMDLYFRNWTDVIIPLTDYIGQNITIEFTVSDCAWGGHLGYVYLDGECLNYTASSTACTGTTNQVRTLTAPDGFINYTWMGPSIIGDYSKKTAVAYKAGTYQVRVVTRGGCSGFLPVTVPACSTSIGGCAISLSSTNIGTCNTNNNSYTFSGNININSPYNKKGVIQLTVGTVTKFYHGPFATSFAFSVPNLYATGTSVNYTVKYFEDDFMDGELCIATGSFTSPTACVTPASQPCANCIGSFKPIVGKTYIVSAWVRQVGASSTTTTYTNPYIEISFNSGATTLAAAYASGKIIDGWQRIYYEFTVPVGSTEISVALKTSSGSADFDDIRIHPIDAGFTSYVYDPVSLKLVAVLDDNNYATFYEYDPEGTLIRTKKETERGIVTITESRENNPKR